MLILSVVCCRALPFFFFNDTATTEIYPLSLHDALPISGAALPASRASCNGIPGAADSATASNAPTWNRRSEEHTSELQSRPHLVCRLLLEKKNKHHCRRAAMLPESTSTERGAGIDMRRD